MSGVTISCLNLKIHEMHINTLKTEVKTDKGDSQKVSKIINKI